VWWAPPNVRSLKSLKSHSFVALSSFIGVRYGKGSLPRTVNYISMDPNATKIKNLSSGRLRTLTLNVRRSGTKSNNNAGVISVEQPRDRAIIIAM
jgi:hypothetical protein